MAVVAHRPIEVDATPPGLLAWLTAVDHKRIGKLYLTAAFAFFLIGGMQAEAMRAELTAPGLQLTDSEGYNQLFTMHGTIMLLLFATPVAAALANFLVPLQIGAADMVFPASTRSRSGSSCSAA